MILPVFDIETMSNSKDRVPQLLLGHDIWNHPYHTSGGFRGWIMNKYIPFY